jgi:hypothetical protein
MKEEPKRGQRRSRPGPKGLLLGVLLLTSAVAFAQQPAGAGTGKTSLPDSPQPKPQGQVSAPEATAIRFIGYATNRSFVFPDIATSPTSISAGTKFKLFVNQSISPAYVLQSAISAGFSQARNSPSAYGQGWDAYGGRFGASMARGSSNAFFGTFLFASVLREDPRFFPQNRPTLWGAMKYSAVRLVVTRHDSGNNGFNTSGILGTLAAETLANVYLPQSEQTGAKTAQRFGTDLAWRFAGNMFKDYWPTIFHSMNLHRLKVIPDPDVTEHPSGPPAF